MPPKPGERSPALGAENHAFADRRLHAARASWCSTPGAATGAAGRRAAATRRRSRASRSGATATGPTGSWTAGCCGSASAPPTPSSTRSATWGSASAPTPPRARPRSTPSSATSCTSTTASSSTTGELRLEPRRRCAETERLLTGKKTRSRGVLLTFAGGLLGLKDAAEHVARWKRLVRDEGWHPFTVLWCVDYVERARAVLDGRLRRGDDPRRQARAAVRPRRRGNAPTASAARSGATSAAPPSTARATAGRCTSWSAPALRIAAARARLRPAHRRRVRGRLRARRAARRAGAAGPSPPRRGPFFDMLESVDLVAPPMTAAEYARARLYLNAGWGARAPRPPASGCTCRPPRTSGGWRCRPTASPTSSWCAAPSSAARGCARRRRWPAPSAPTAARPTRRGTSAAPSIRSRPAPRGSRPSGTPGPRRRAPTLVPIGWPDEGRARRPGADHPARPALPLRRRRPPAGGAGRRRGPRPRTGTVLKGA